MQDKLIRKYFNMLETPIIILNSNGDVEWTNQSAKTRILPFMNSESWVNSYKTLPEGYIYRLNDGIPQRDNVMIEGILDTDPKVLLETQELRRQKQELEELIESTLNEWFVTDGNGIAIQVNKRFEQMYGINRNKIIGRSVFELEHEKIFYPSVTAMVLRQGEPQTILQTTFKGRRLIVTGSPILNDDGSIHRVVANAIDITNMHIFSRQRPSTIYLQPHSNGTSPTLIAGTPAIQECLKLAAQVAESNVSILLLGETGVGKNRFAKYIHEHSQRKEHPFVEINCASIPESLLESELFGYERGSFTGARKEGKKGRIELADNGTLFLNEIGELPLALQGKLLDLVQEHIITRIGATVNIPIDVRIIAATNRDLERMVLHGEFRSDLYYRLNVVPIHIPALRERKGDIPSLANLSLRRFAEKHKSKLPLLSPEAIDVLKNYTWPGNLRELENTMERLVVTSQVNVIEPVHLPTNLHKNLREQDSVKFSSINKLFMHNQNFNLKKRLEDIEREFYLEAVNHFKTTYEIAEHFQVSQPTVVRKLRQYQISSSIKDSHRY